jgi:PLP dependent protein
MYINRSVIDDIDKLCVPYHAKWIAVTKTRPNIILEELLACNKLEFGENKAQELSMKASTLSEDIQWHFIGHLQSNKIKQILDYEPTIHAVDSHKLLFNIQKEACKLAKNIDVFMQIHIAKEETKYGMLIDEAKSFFESNVLQDFPNLHIKGLMAMASFTNDNQQIAQEFRAVKNLQAWINTNTSWSLNDISMGMSNDYKIALDEGSTLLRIGSLLYN